MRNKAILVALALIALALLATETFIAQYVTRPRESRERVLQQDLFTMRQILDQYVLDKHRRPQSLSDLVAAGYFKQIPLDPTTGRNDTWVLEWSRDPKTPGITGIRSGTH